MSDIKLFSACLSNVGQKRNNNEDYVTYFEAETEQELSQSGNLYIVADGVGGAAKGERASSFAAQKVLFEYYQLPDIPPAERLRRLLREAGNHIFQYAESESFGRMATTMVVAVVRNGKLLVAHVGDSRAYLWRNGKLGQLTRDHSLVGEMVRDGTMTEEESMHSKVKNRLTRSLGGEEDVHVDVSPEIELLPGDRILLCTDGLTRYAAPTDLMEMLPTGGPVQVVETLIKFANQKGGADNITALVVSVHGLTESVNWAATAAHPRPTSPIWEQETDPSAETQYPIHHKKKVWAQWIPLGALAVLLAAVLGIGMFAVGQQPGKMATIRPELTPAATGTPVPTLSPNPTPSDFLLQPGLASPVALPLATATPSQVSCEYIIQSGDTVSQIVAKLEIVLPADGTISCEPSDAIQCKDDRLVKNGNISPRLKLTFLNVNRQKCIEQGGTPIEPTPVLPEVNPEKPAPSN